MIEGADRVAIKTAVAKLRWRVRNLRLTADELDEVAGALDALIHPPARANAAPAATAEP